MNSSSSELRTPSRFASPSTSVVAASSGGTSASSSLTTSGRRTFKVAWPETVEPRLSEVVALIKTFPTPTALKSPAVSTDATDGASELQEKDTSGTT